MPSIIKKSLGLAETATDEEVAAALAKRDADAKEVADKVADLEKRATLSDSTRAHYDGLVKAAKDDAGKKKAQDFLDMKEDDRKKEVAKLAEDDETITLEGRSISKRVVGDDTFAVLKGQAERIAKTEADIAKAEDARQTAEFQKRAQADYPHVAGTVEERASVLKFLATAPADVQKAADAIFKAAEGAAKFAFEKAGARGGSIEKRNAEDQLEAKAKEIEKRDKVSFAKAYDTAMTEHPELYEATLSRPVQE